MNMALNVTATLMAASLVLAGSVQAQAGNGQDIYDCDRNVDGRDGRLECVLHNALSKSDFDAQLKNNVQEIMADQNAARVFMDAMLSYNWRTGKGDVVVSDDGALAIQGMSLAEGVNETIRYAAASVNLDAARKLEENHRALDEYNRPNNGYMRVSGKVEQAGFERKICRVAFMHMVNASESTTFMATFCKEPSGITAKPMELARYHAFGHVVPQ